MTTPASATTSAAPAAVVGNGGHPPVRGHPCCFIGDDTWHRAHTRIELPPESHLEAYWHAEILDDEAKNPLTRIIERRENFVVRLRVELCGRLWRCISGHWCFNVGFTAIGAGQDFNLSQLLLPGTFQVPDWEGCKTLCVEKCVPVPAGTIPAGTIPAEHCGTVYEVAAWFELRCCGGCDDPNSHLAVSGFERLGEYQFV
jgi:hypothetical protein